MPAENKIPVGGIQHCDISGNLLRTYMCSLRGGERSTGPSLAYDVYVTYVPSWVRASRIGVSSPQSRVSLRVYASCSLTPAPATGSLASIAS